MTIENYPVAVATGIHRTYAEQIAAGAIKTYRAQNVTAGGTWRTYADQITDTSIMPYGAMVTAGKILTYAQAIEAGIPQPPTPPVGPAPAPPPEESEEVTSTSETEAEE
jgi:hypothetical protein